MNKIIDIVERKTKAVKYEYIDKIVETLKAKGTPDEYDIRCGLVKMTADQLLTLYQRIKLISGEI